MISFYLDIADYFLCASIMAANDYNNNNTLTIIIIIIVILVLIIITITPTVLLCLSYLIKKCYKLIKQYLLTLLQKMVIYVFCSKSC